MRESIKLIYLLGGLIRSITRMEKRAMFAYAGKILRVDLNTGKVQVWKFVVIK